MMEKALFFSLFLRSSLLRAEVEKNLNLSDTAQPCLSDIHKVLREMTGATAELQIKVQNLQIENQAQAAKLKELEEQKTPKQQVEDFQDTVQAELASLKKKSNVTENHVEALRRDRENGQVAFSASLFAAGAGHYGPFNNHHTLVFRYVFSNIGNAYSPDTGFFTAPVKGAYHFEFYIGAFRDDHHCTAAVLLKNEGHVVIAYERSIGGHPSAANGATLLLEPGDKVYLKLWKDTRIHDNENHHSTFSGHLLFPM